MTYYDKNNSYSAEIIDADKQHIWHMLTQHSIFAGKDPLVAVSGEGCTITDVGGNRYLDAIAGLWCVNVGWGRDRLAVVACEQMRKLPFYPMTQSHVPAFEFSVQITISVAGPYPGLLYQLRFRGK